MAKTITMSVRTKSRMDDYVLIGEGYGRDWAESTRGTRLSTEKELYVHLALSNSLTPQRGGVVIRHENAEAWQDYVDNTQPQCNRLLLHRGCELPRQIREDHGARRIRRRSGVRTANALGRFDSCCCVAALTI